MNCLVNVCGNNMEDNFATISVDIRNNSTNQIKTLSSTVFTNDNGEPNDFIWSEGNYACDCNRAMFFHDDYETDFKCSDDEFSVRLKDGNGKIFYDEFENNS